MHRSQLPLRLRFRHLPPQSAHTLAPRSRSREKSLAGRTFTKGVAERESKRAAIDADRVLVLAQMYAAYCAAAGYSPRTIETRQATFARLHSFLLERGHTSCGGAELIELAGSLRNNLNGRELRSWTTLTIYGHLRAFFKWLVDQKVLDTSPHDAVPRPIRRKDQIVPHTTEEVRLLLEAARNSYYPRRNVAMVRFMVDTGIRATECCNLRLKDIDLRERKVEVLGKGNKKRTLHFGVQASRALWAYLGGRNYVPGESDDGPLFAAESGRNQGGALTRLGLLQLINGLGSAAGIRSNPHKLRHTFAVNYIINGGDAFSLMTLLGHTDLQTSNAYVLLAQANLAQKHAKLSPMDNMGF
jgi:site-specific recombinase XerD